MDLVEIACDESGSEGEKLIGATTDVFAHASVRFDLAEAARGMALIRAHAPTPAVDFKANHVLREKNRAGLLELLGPAGPLHDRARVHLVDKAYYLVGKVVDLLVARVAPAPGPFRDPRTATTAAALHHGGLRAFGADRWEAFLVAANDLMRVQRRGPVTPVEAFFGAVDALRGDRAATGEVAAVLDLIGAARPHAGALRAQLLGRRTSALDPLVAAVVDAVEHWSGGRTCVAVVHDSTPALSAERLAGITELLTPPDGSRGGLLARLTLADSRTDPRVQIADVVAGVARKIAADALNGRADPELTPLLRPFVSPTSVWGDDRSWSLLAASAAR